MSAQIICCFVPPLALQLGARSFLKSYEGLPLSGICGIMVRNFVFAIVAFLLHPLNFSAFLFQVADIFIYSILAWYFSQVWPSKVGVSKPGWSK